MTKIVKTIGVIAGAVALVVPGLQAVGVASIAGVSSATVAGVAGLIAGVANLAVGRAGSRPPPARGSVTDVVIEVDAPMPYVMGEGYVGGVLRHRVGYGPTLNGVPNPYLWEVDVYSHGGPIEGPIVPYNDYKPVTAWYNGFFDHDSQLGACPEAGALTPPYGAAPEWDASYKLSGQAAIGRNHKFDRDGKRYANGLGVWGAHAKWVRVYDPRLDSTFPGGAGACRLGTESTYVWSENPALHAGTYAYGRYENGKRVLGMGLPVEAIRFDQIAAWANDCEANGWTIFGRIFEPGDRWANLRDICAAGGGEPVPLRTGIGFDWERPRVVLDTITRADITGEIDIAAMQSYRSRINTIVPRYVSPAHNWTLITADPIVGDIYLAEDGEERREAWPFNFVKGDDQAGQLAAYRLAAAREFFPIELRCSPRLRRYRPGDCLQLTIYEDDDLVIDAPVVIQNADLDEGTLEPTFVLMGETPAKHAWALGKSATPPPTPALGMSSQERDELAAAAQNPAGYISNLIRTSNQGPVTITATDTAITIGNHDRIYSDVTKAITGTTLSEDDQAAALAPETRYYLYYDDQARAGGAVTFKATTDFWTAQHTAATPWRHYSGYITTDVIGGGGTGGGGTTPPGGGGGSDNPYP